MTIVTMPTCFGDFGLIERWDACAACGVKFSCVESTLSCRSTDDATTDAQYKVLKDVLDLAYAQASKGKGAERHGQDIPFERQPMQTISGLLNSHTGLLYQAMKKIQESERLPHDRAEAELLGAINYIAGAIIFKRAHKKDAPGA